MKRLLWIVLILLIIGGGLTWYYFSGRSPAYLKHVPQETALVLVVNTDEFAQLFLSEKVMNGDRVAALQERFRQLGEGFGGEPEAIGLDMLISPMGFMMSPDPATVNEQVRAGLFFDLSDSETFERFVQRNLPAELMASDKYRWMYVPEQRMGLAWTKDFGVLMELGSETALKSFIERILHLPESEQLLQQYSQVESLYGAEAEVAAWASPKALMQDSTWAESTLFLHFEYGQVHVESHARLALDWAEGIHSLQGETDRRSFPPAHANGMTRLDAANTWSFLQELKWVQDIPLSTELAAFFEAWSGRLDFRLSGSKTISQVYITYEYDEEFNRVPIESTRTAEVPDFDLLLEMPDVHTLENLLGSWTQQQYLIPREGHYKLRQVLDMELFLKALPGYLLICTDSLRMEQVGPVQLVEQDLPDALAGYTLYPPVLQQLQETSSALLGMQNLLPDQVLKGVEKITVELSQPEPDLFSASFKLHLQEKDFNSLLALLGWWMGEMPPKTAS